MKGLKKKIVLIDVRCPNCSRLLGRVSSTAELACKCGLILLVNPQTKKYKVIREPKKIRALRVPVNRD